MKKHGALWRVTKAAGIVAGCCFALAAVFSLWYLIEFYPRTAESFEMNSPDQPTRILVATQGSEFKNGLVTAVCDRLRKQPVHAFRLNRDVFQGSWNVYDSYADALLASGDREGAIANYRKSLELNPNHEAGRQRLAELI